jgi:hypothetical protein
VKSGGQEYPPHTGLIALWITRLNSLSVSH